MINYIIAILMISLPLYATTIIYDEHGHPDYEKINEQMQMDEKLNQAIQEISKRHREILDDFCKAYMAQLYEEGVELKPGCFTLNEQHMDNVGGSVLGKRYWFSMGTPSYRDNEWISVNEKLPQESGYYLAYWSGNENCTGFVAQSLFYVDSTFTPIRPNSQITHWMPLPNHPSKNY